MKSPEKSELSSAAAARAQAAAPVAGSQTAEAVAARKSSNLAFSFLSLDGEQRQAMSVFYDFCRRVDDVADDRERADADKAEELAAWRTEVSLVCALAAAHGEGGSSAAGEQRPLRYCGEMVGVIRRYNLREADLLAIVDGVSMDIGKRRFETFEDLRVYCYGVASAVGLCCVRIFGCKSPQIDAYAEALGYALQFTNILRDVVEDYVEMGRVYLPQAELRAFGVSEADLASPAGNERCRKLFALCHYRASHFFAKARRLLPHDDRDKLIAAFVMEAFYSDILDKIRARNFQLTVQRVRLSKGRKFALLLRTLWRSKRRLPAYVQPGSVAVLGGGVAGIRAATALGAEGFTPHLYEARPQLGGRAHSFTDASSGITLDNAQHIVMGCYSSFIGFARQLDIADKFSAQSAISVPYRSQGGVQTWLKAPELPAPLHLLAALSGFKALSWRDRLAILRLGLVIRLRGLPSPDLPAAQWLSRHGQTAGAIRTIWEPFCLAALNTPLETSSARVLAQTLRRSLLGAKDAAAIWIARVPMSELFEPQTAIYLESIGGSVRCQCGIQSLEPSADGRRLAAAVTRSGERIEADWFVSALPWQALAKLLPAGAALLPKLAALKTSPIIGIHVVCETKLFDNAEGFVGLLDSPLHWVFDRTDALPEAEQHAGKRLYALVTSVADTWMDLKKDALEARVRGELERFFPETAKPDMPIDRIVTYKSQDATFEATVAAEAARPVQSIRPQPALPAEANSPWANLLLAGDWLVAGLPATLESAAQSGELRGFLDALPPSDSASGIAKTRA